jgi:hypothetical protein
MQDIIEHYGKVIIALAGILAATLITVAVVATVNKKTNAAVDNIQYDSQISDAINKSLDNKNG